MAYFRIYTPAFVTDYAQPQAGDSIKIFMARRSQRLTRFGLWRMKPKPALATSQWFVKYWLCGRIYWLYISPPRILSIVRVRNNKYVNTLVFIFTCLLFSWLLTHGLFYFIFSDACMHRIYIYIWKVYCHNTDRVRG